MKISKNFNPNQIDQLSWNELYEVLNHCRTVAAVNNTFFPGVHLTLWPDNRTETFIAQNTGSIVWCLYDKQINLRSMKEMTPLKLFRKYIEISPEEAIHLERAVSQVLLSKFNLLSTGNLVHLRDQPDAHRGDEDFRVLYHGGNGYYLLRHCNSGLTRNYHVSELALSEDNHAPFRH